MADERLLMKLGTCSKALVVQKMGEKETEIFYCLLGKYHSCMKGRRPFKKVSRFTSSDSRSFFFYFSS